MRWNRFREPWRRVFRAAAVLAAAFLSGTAASGQAGVQKLETLPIPKASADTLAAASPASTLNPQVQPIDLCAAMKLAGVYNPEILLARERVVEADAARQFAAAQILPTINVGANVDHHQGTLQQSTGQIIKVNRGSLYLGLGASAVGAGTVNVPGIVWSGNVGEGIYAALVSRQVVTQRMFESDAVRNDVLLRVAAAYLELLRATGRRAIVSQARADAAEVGRVTANFAEKGQGKQSDADRAAAELQLRNDELLQAEADLGVASARLAQLLSLDPEVRLHPADGWVVPAPIVPDPIPLPELLAIALTQRPELKASQAAVRAALLRLQEARVLPFSPTVLVGYSNGSFGGGGNVATQTNAQTRFGNFDDRQDVDAVLYWSLRNLGVGNLALVKLARSNLRQEELRQVEVLDGIRAEVAAAFARVHARYAQIGTGQKAAEVSRRGFEQDLVRTRNGVGLPIEVLDSLRLLQRSRLAYLDAIIDYNRAQFELYVALGQPPACTLARPVPASLGDPVAPSAPAANGPQAPKGPQGPG
jgi:outer membrane protein TolC